jgi:LacI family transcriptional regulator
MKLLQYAPEITALICHNDLVAIGAMHACRKLKLRIPEDCAVVGHNDVALAAMVNPTITTVRVDRYRLGQELMSRALAMVNDPDGDYPPIIMPVDGLIKRESA